MTNPRTISILFAMIWVLGYCMTGCGPSAEEKRRMKEQGIPIPSLSNQIWTSSWVTVEYDGCQYIKTGGDQWMHKGNCKNHSK